MSSRSSEELVAHLFRSEYGKLLAVLASGFGLSQLQVAEDIVQDTLLSAVHHFSLNGVPDNPAAWLMQVAKNKALNHLKHSAVRARVDRELGSGEAEDIGGAVEPASEAFLNSDIEDARLRMMFACCHPLIAVEDQLALVLKTLCGFGSREVASALLVPEPTVNKRIYRAKQLLRKEGQLEVPGGETLRLRLGAVCQSVYLLFNEGYASTEAPQAIRRDLCLEAMHLGEMLRRRFPEAPSLAALMARSTSGPGCPEWGCRNGNWWRHNRRGRGRRQSSSRRTHPKRVGRLAGSSQRRLPGPRGQRRRPTRFSSRFAWDTELQGYASACFQA